MDLKKLVLEEFSGVNAQSRYAKHATDGLWSSEAYFINKYFTMRGASLLDIGCGTGRTTMPLFRQGYDVVAIDFVPAMIESAKRIALQQNLAINYLVGDATNLEFKEGTFDYAIFSNQGWTQIPGRMNRLRALTEVRRVLKDGGLFIFTAHSRVWTNNFWFWVKQWIRFYVLKSLGVSIPEEDFGDRFFDRETNDDVKTYKTRQYIHIPTTGEVVKQIENSGLKVLEVSGSLQISNSNIRKHPPVFYVCQK